MARTPLVFSKATGAQTGTTYTVEAGKYAIVDASASINPVTATVNTYATVACNGVVVCTAARLSGDTGASYQAVTNGTIVPAGGTIQAVSSAAGGSASATGFLYDL